MPRIAFKEENVKKNDYNYPKIKLDKGEIVRVVLLEDPEVEYVHNLRKPKIVAGEPVVTVKERRDGTTYEDYVYEFVSRPICLGDFATLEAEGSDPDHCPICAEATRNDRVSSPQRRFSLHLVKYDTKPNGKDVKEPFSAQTLIWSFTDKVFTKLYEAKQEWGDLRAHDLYLKCENKDFQTYEISVAQEAAWRQDDKRKDYIKELMAKDNLAPELSIFCGSKKTEKQIGFDLRAIAEAWEVATGETKQADHAMSSVGGSLSLGAGLDDLLNSDSKKDAEGWHVEEKSDASPVASFDELGEEDTLASSVSASDSDDIDALLKGI